MLFRSTENSLAHISDAENSSKDRLLDESTYHRNFQRTGIGTNTSRKQVTFADQKIPIDKSLSHKKSSRNRPKRSKYPRPGLRRSQRNSRQNLVQMASFDWPELLAFFISFGSIIFFSTPILTDCFSGISQQVHDKVIKFMEDQIEEVPDLSNECASMRTLRYYHHILDNSREPEDS